jgi:hypothetical protein
MTLATWQKKGIFTLSAFHAPFKSTSGTKSMGPLWVQKSKNLLSKGSHLCLK